MIALVLTLCTFAACNDYYIDSDESWQTPKDCTGAMWSEYDSLKALGVRDYLISRKLESEIPYTPVWELSCTIVDEKLIP